MVNTKDISDRQITVDSSIFFENQSVLVITQLVICPNCTEAMQTFLAPLSDFTLRVDDTMIQAFWCPRCEGVSESDY